VEGIDAPGCRLFREALVSLRNAERSAANREARLVLSLEEPASREERNRRCRVARCSMSTGFCGSRTNSRKQRSPMRHPSRSHRLPGSLNRGRRRRVPWSRPVEAADQALILSGELSGASETLAKQLQDGRREQDAGHRYVAGDARRYRDGRPDAQGAVGAPRTWHYDSDSRRKRADPRVVRFDGAWTRSPGLFRANSLIDGAAAHLPPTGYGTIPRNHHVVGRRDGKVAYWAATDTYARQVVVKASARKGGASITTASLAGFAGGTADAFTLFETVRGEARQHQGICFARRWSSPRIGAPTGSCGAWRRCSQ